MKAFISLIFFLPSFAFVVEASTHQVRKPVAKSHRNFSAKPRAKSQAKPDAKVSLDSAWVANARRLSGESDAVRNRAMHDLKATPKIETILKEALITPRRFLAMDVISTLKLTNLIPDLVQYSENDETGTYYLALNSLITSFNEKEFKELYAKRLLSGNSPAVARMILIDTLLRMQFRLTPRQLRELLVKDESPEVRSSALYYLRATLLHESYDDFVPLLREVLEDKNTSRQLKMQALFLASELSPELFQKIRDIRAPCLLPAPAALKLTCERFLDGSLVQ
ncbi:MAG: hypothetical protein H7333_02670 [Bdellovibrionales bacterium]|nr:hypothetical protein [Oligoflexia bacterium]